MIVMMDYADRLPRTAHMFSMEIAHLNSSLNPLLYAIFNPAFQRGYMLVFRLLLRTKRNDGRKSSQAQVFNNHIGIGAKFRVTSNNQPSHMSIPNDSIIHKI